MFTLLVSWINSVYCLTNVGTLAVYYPVMNDRLRTRRKCRKHEPQAIVFHIFRVFSNVRSVLSQRNARLRLVRLPYISHCEGRNNKEHRSRRNITLMKHGFLTNQGERRVLCHLLETHSIISVAVTILLIFII